MTNHTNQNNDAKAIHSMLFAAIAAAATAAIMLQLGGCSGTSCHDACLSSQNATVRVVVAREEVSTPQGVHSAYAPAVSQQDHEEYVFTAPRYTVEPIVFIEETPESDSQPSPAQVSMHNSMFAPFGIQGDDSFTDVLKSVSQVSYATVGSDFDPDVDPTGTFVVYASTQHNLSSDIYRKAIGGRTTTQLTNDAAQELMPEISPDGSKVAFSSDRNGNWDVFVMSVDGGPSMQITFDAEHEMHPTWSSDGKSMAYCRYNDRATQWEIWTVDVEKPSVRSFICEGMFPRWSPEQNVNRLLFQRSRKRADRLFGIWTVEVVDGNGCNPTEILSSGDSAIMHPNWSPNGKTIVFATVMDPQTSENGMPKNAEIWTIGLDGTSKTALTSGGYCNLRPTWGATDKVFFTSNRAGVDNIWSVSTSISEAQGFGEGMGSEIATVDQMLDTER